MSIIEEFVGTNRHSLMFVDSTLLNINQMEQLNIFYGVSEQSWKLLYKATRCNFDAEILHKMCDNCGPTLILVSSENGSLFGGFTTVSWSINNEWYRDPLGFLFTLVNPHNLPPTKFVLKDSKSTSHAVSFSKNGITFGEQDLCINGNKGFTNFPNLYGDVTGKRHETFTGQSDFYITDIEIYQPTLCIMGISRHPQLYIEQRDT